MLGDRKERRHFAIQLDAELMAEAEAVGINVQAACEMGIRQRIVEARQWLEENREAIEASNRWFEEYGLPFSEYRRF